VDVAHALNSEIVSADSRQIYRGLDIGSGKDLEEYSRVNPAVRHHLIDVADPCSIYSLFHYQRDCYRLLELKAREQPFAGGTPLLMVGGTGLYVESVLRGFRIANVPEDVELRERLMQRERSELVEELLELDPELASRTDESSKKRVVRALEIVAYSREQTVRYSEDPPVAIEYSVFGIDVAREELHRRIDRRLDERLAHGLIEEVEGLLAGGVDPPRMAQLGLEYREVTAFLTGAKQRDQMVEDLRREIHRFAKRQRTWFRGLPRRGIDLTWIEPGDVETVLDRARPQA
jgi:tRNA dimethylallyltransferase